MGMSREYRPFPLGSVVLVKRGHHAGSVFVVIGVDNRGGSDDMPLIADGRHISARKPKRKNPRHISAVGVVSGDVAARLARGKRIDDGWLCEVISRLEVDGSRLILREVGQSVCQKTTS
jgi:hypothetical protein